MVATDLAESDEKQLEKHAKAIDRAKGGVVKSAIRIGAELDAAHVLLANHHKGTWGCWVADRCGLKPSTARNYLRAFRTFGSCSTVEQLDDGAMYLLAAPSTPDDVLEAAVEKSEAGERVTRDWVKQQIDGDESPEDLDGEAKPKPAVKPGGSADIDGVINDLCDKVEPWEPWKKLLLAEQLRMLADELESL